LRVCEKGYLVPLIVKRRRKKKRALLGKRGVLEATRGDLGLDQKNGMIKLFANEIKRNNGGRGKRGVGKRLRGRTEKPTGRR